MTSSHDAAALDAVARLAAETPGLDVLLVFGSRARGDAHDGSDWDLGFLASAVFDPAWFLGALVERVHNDRVDLVDLRRAGGLLRYRAARDGRVLHEARPGLADEFRLQAIDFWCDVGPLLQRGYDRVLAELEK
jgi:predicted nucleotidyltransferase